MEIRLMAEQDDRTAVGGVYAASWKEAYRGILPQSSLDALRAERWSGCLDLPGRHNFLLLDGGQIVGVSAVSAARAQDMAGWGEVISLYLLPAYQGRGYGKALLTAALQHLGNLGFRQAYLWVLEENRRARRFYEAFGFRESGVVQEECVEHVRLQELRYVWEGGRAHAL